MFILTNKYISIVCIKQSYNPRPTHIRNAIMPTRVMSKLMLPRLVLICENGKFL